MSPVAIWYWTVRAAFGWAALLLLQGIWVAAAPAPAALHWAALVATLVLGSAHLVVMPQWRYHVHRWEVSPIAVYTQAGWFHQERRIAPLSRIQTVDSERGPLERLFGLARVTTNTASAAGPLQIVGLRQWTAAELAEQLTRLAQQSPGDAT
ncbi:MAG: PH domain-containing protein [Candidatus Dormibacteria bacterium]